MNRDEIHALVRAERLSLADFLDDLTEPEWAVPSLCGDWTVHEVLAHTTLSSADTLGGTILGIIRARGNWDRMNADQARAHAARYTPVELIAQLRDSADATKLALGASPLDPLVDMMIHGQDIARPLGRVREMSPELGVVALDFVLGHRFYGARKRLNGIRLTAVDADWSAGEGSDEIHGLVSDLLLVATGRSAGLTGCSGSAVAALTTRL